MLEVTSLGHACSLLQLGGLSILCDPHFHESYGSRLFTHDPPRIIDVSGLPEPDLVFLSHRHRDHFDVRSLAMLNKSTPVFAADDPEIHRALEHLGFKTVKYLRDWSRFRIGTLELIATPSLYRVPEHGLLLIAPDACVWNMVDSVVDVQIIARALEASGRGVDVLLWPYQPLKETAAVDGETLELPRDGFQGKLETLELIAPKVVVPYADGQLGRGPASWLNHYRFPLSSEDVRGFASSIGQFQPVPLGHRLRYRAGECSCSPVQGLVLPSAEAAPETVFDATRAMPALSELGLGAASSDELGELISALTASWQAIAGRPGSSSLRDAMLGWSAYYDLILEHGEGRTTVRFGADGRAQVEQGVARRRPGRCGVIRASASTLIEIQAGRLHFVSAYLGGLLRSWSSFYRVERGSVSAPHLQSSPGAAAIDSLLTPTMFLNALISQSGQLSAKVLEHELMEAEAWRS